MKSDKIQTSKFSSSDSEISSLPTCFRSKVIETSRDYSDDDSVIIIDNPEITKPRDNDDLPQNIIKNYIKVKEDSSEIYETPPFTHPDKTDQESDGEQEENLSKEQIFTDKIAKAREIYLKSVQDALEELNSEPPDSVNLSFPPKYEKMADIELENHLETFGFRFTTRDSAISKLNRCWAATTPKNIYQTSNPIEFIRNKSQYYEQMLIYSPVPLAALKREMSDSGINISITRLRAILDDEGVAYLDEESAK